MFYQVNFKGAFIREGRLIPNSYFQEEQEILALKMLGQLFISQ